MSSVYHRVNTGLLIVVALIGVSIIAMLATGVRGGPLDPTGVPAPTDGVRGPGTPISSLPYTISQSGYYYVTRNLFGGTGQDGITITASNVTLDLGGFTLFGGTSPQNGIVASGPRYVTVRNGNVRGWSYGINVSVTYSRIEHVRATNNTVTGIVISGESTVEDCVASINGLDGIVATTATVRRCTVSENGQAGILSNDRTVIEGNRITFNPGYGLFVQGDFNNIRGNEMNASATADIYVGGDGNALFENVSCDPISNAGLNNVIAASNHIRAGGC